ncbi:MAG: MBL fold metallo-hydrolase [Myxococcota bacterium]|nr:MBL fold metallo-hydrolase [Myxococcota bacterium]
MIALLLACQPPVDSDATPIQGIELTWLGVTTLLLQTQQTSLLLDPFFSRPAYGQEGSTLEGQERAASVLRAAGIEQLDAIVVGHSHFDHAVDVGTIAAQWGATVYGSPTTCAIASVQGLEPERCVPFAEEFTVGPLSITPIRTPHWWADVASIGAHAVYEGEPDIDTVSAAPNGGMYSLLIESADGRVFFQDSMDPLDADDGSGVDFAALIDAGLSGQPVDLWVMCGDCLTEASALAEYTERLKPDAILPLHWDSTMPALEAGVGVSFEAPEALLELGAEVLVPDDYRARYRLDAGAFSALAEPLSVPAR